MEYNPYQAPATPPPLAPPTAPYSHYGEAQMSPGAAQELLGTQGWVRFVGIMMLVISGLMLLSMLNVFSDISSARDSMGYRRSSSYDNGVMFGQVVGLLIIGFLYVYPAVLLSKYASAINRFRKSYSMTDVQAALRHQRFFWRFVGIVLIVVLSLFLLMLLLGMSGRMFRWM